MNELEGTSNEEIKNWLLTEVHKNSDYESFVYVTLLCANTGGLLRALKKPSVDLNFLKGANAIFNALIFEIGGREDITDYQDGFEAFNLYLKHLERVKIDSEIMKTLNLSKKFLSREEPFYGALSNKTISDLGWTKENREEVQSKVVNLMQSI